MPSIFSKIASGEIPCTKVWENDEFLAFLDIQPVSLGHTLVIPKKEIDYFFDLESEHYGRLMEVCRVISLGLKKATRCKRVCMGVWGFEVPHAHVHLIPMNGLSEFPFPPRQATSPEDLRAMGARIAAQF